MTVRAPRRQQHQTASAGGQGGGEGVPGDVANVAGLMNIIHSRPADLAFVKNEAARFDNIDADPQACGQAQQCSGILRYIRLKKGESKAFQRLSR